MTLNECNGDIQQSTLVAKLPGAPCLRLSETREGGEDGGNCKSQVSHPRDMGTGLLLATWGCYASYPAAPDEIVPSELFDRILIMLAVSLEDRGKIGRPCGTRGARRAGGK